MTLLRSRAEEHREALAYGFLTDGETDLVSTTHGDLDREARRIATVLSDRMAPGGRALLLYEPGLDFLAALFGCLYAGVVAVPVIPPVPSRLQQGLEHVVGIVLDARADVILTSEALAGLCPDLIRLSGTGGLSSIPTDGSAGRPDSWRDPGVRPESLALIQYTSGSTGSPKGVMLSHGNLLANQRAIDSAFRLRAPGVLVSWLPLYHDMGLIGCVLHSLYRGFPCYLMSPLHFLERPVRWLRAISRVRGTCSGGPSFAYELCARRVGPADRADLDLSSWETAFCGSEPIRPDTLRRFAEAFAPNGFRASSLAPCYGLAEASLLVTGTSRASGMRTLRVVREDLQRGRVTVAGPVVAGHAEVVSAGAAQPEHDLIVVDPVRGTRLDQGLVGEVWFRGPSVAAGYWNARRDTESVFGATCAGQPGRYLRTGDIGFVVDGEVFITGRLKDVIVVRGRNVHPHDIEDTAQRADGRLRAGCGAAFGVDLGDTDGVVLVQETGDVASEQLEELAQSIRRAVLEAASVTLSSVVLVPPRSIPKTSSGKIRRRACQGALIDGSLPVRYADGVYRSITEPPARAEASARNRLRARTSGKAEHGRRRQPRADGNGR